MLFGLICFLGPEFPFPTWSKTICAEGRGANFEYTSYTMSKHRYEEPQAIVKMSQAEESP